MKKIRVRESKVRDVGLFKSLWLEFLKDQENSGSLTVADDKALTTFEALFSAYTKGDLEGIVLFVSTVGVLMAGDLAANVNHRTGKTANIWGVYVREEERGKGIATAMFNRAKESLKDMGFDAAMLALPVKDLRSVVSKNGFVPIMLYHYLPLEEEEIELDDVVEEGTKPETGAVNDSADESASTSGSIE